METRNDRFPCHLGCRQPGVRQKGELVGAGVDGNECSLLITHCRATAAWVLLLASANTKVTVTSSLIRKRSPPRPPPHPCRKVCGKHHPLLKILDAEGGQLGNGFFVFSFHFGAEMCQLRFRRISACKHFLFLCLFFVFSSFSPFLTYFLRGGTVLIAPIQLLTPLQLSLLRRAPRHSAFHEKCYHFGLFRTANCFSIFMQI